MSRNLRGTFTRFGQYAVLITSVGCTSFFVQENDNDVVRPRGKSIAFVDNKAYTTECTSCHVGFLPGFLPDRSWKKLMGDLENHFGENASLDDGPRNEILKYVTANAADKPTASARSHKIARMIPAKETPLRITETPFWVKKHASIKSYVWKRPSIKSKSGCDTCHRDAAKGIYDEHDVHIPK